MVMPKKLRKYVYYELKFWQKRKNFNRRPRMRVHLVPRTHQIHPTMINNNFTLPIQPNIATPPPQPS